MKQLNLIKNSYLLLINVDINIEVANDTGLTKSTCKPELGKLWTKCLIDCYRNNTFEIIYD